MRKKIPFLIVLILGLTMMTTAMPGQQEGAPPQRPQGAPAAQQAKTVPADLSALLASRQSEMAAVVERYKADREDLAKYYHCMSDVRFARLVRFDLDWQTALAGLKSAKLSAAARKELGKLEADIQADLKGIAADAAAASQIAPFVPFSGTVVGLEEARMRMETVDAEKSALAVAGAIESIKSAMAGLAARLQSGAGLEASVAGRDIVLRAADRVKDLRGILKQWFAFYNDYDPLFTWWLAQPYKEADKLLDDYSVFLRDKLAPAVQTEKGPAPVPVQVTPAAVPAFAEVPDLQRLLKAPQDEMRTVVEKFRGRSGRYGGWGGSSPAAPDVPYLKGWLTALNRLDFNKLSRPAQIDYLYLRNSIDVQLAQAARPYAPGPQAVPDQSGIKGKPIGREALISSLKSELVPYTPEELIAVAEKQYAWCEAEMKKAAAEMGFGDDWKAAMEKVKDMHAAPGGQPAVVRDLLHGAVDYIRAHDMITVPEVEWETLTMVMITAQQQLVSPFFLGGDVIMVAYPTSTMTTRQKLESMRGNNDHFSHATAFHEMIPGHNLQGYMEKRLGKLRSDIGTPFWIEGWALYWETLLYENGYQVKPEDRIGAMFWRMHRSARIIFSLKYHMGEWSAQKCIDFLVDKVNFERENATAEVRRSFSGGYPPLYQLAYMTGCLQLRELKKDLVDSGRMTLKQFNDAIIERPSMPITLLRLSLGNQKLARDMSLEWRCFGDPLKGN